MVLVGSGTFEFVQGRTWHDCLMLCLLFSCTVYAAQKVCAERGDNVMVARDPEPENGHSI
jgi:hypothetical protein